MPDFLRKVFRLFIFLFFFNFLYYSEGYAQIDDEEINKILNSKGISAKDKEKIKKGLAQKTERTKENESEESQSKKSGDRQKRILDKDKYEEFSIENEDLEKNRIRRKTFADSIYGMNIFNNEEGNIIARKLTSLETFDLATPPDDYPIGYGDQILLSMWGPIEEQFDYLVAKDGSIFPRDLGKIFVGGLRFSEMRQIFTARLKKYVPQGTQIQITMGQPRTVYVNVSGNVRNPGVYTVSAFANALNVLALAGGINEYGNLREILVKRNGVTVSVIDIYQYLQKGDYGNKIYLKNGDFIIVKDFDKIVKASGEFKRPLYYQMKNNEGLKDLVRLAAGFNSSALLSNIQIQRYDKLSQQLIIKNVNYNDVVKLGEREDLRIDDGDVVLATKISSRIVNVVKIEGPVLYPDYYQVNTGTKKIRLFELIDKAGGLLPNAYLDRAFVYKEGFDSLKVKLVDRLEINLNNYIDYKKGIIGFNHPSNIALEPFDLLRIEKKDFYRDRRTISVVGEVRSPGVVEFSDSLNLLDVLFMSGGLKQSAEYGALEISRVLDIDSAKLNLKPVRVTVLKLAIDPEFKNSEIAKNTILRPYDQVIVRPNPDFELQQNISIEGQIVYPGVYPKLSKTEKLSSFITRAGGLKTNADKDGAILLRNPTNERYNNIINGSMPDSTGKDSILIKSEKMPISIDLDKALKNKNSKWDLILKDGDILYIPEINQFVTVKGNVQSPLKLNFDKEHTTLSYYIDKAGGFGVRPWRKRIFVTYSNGKSRRTRNFLGIKFYPPIKSGCVITVPERPESKNDGVEQLKQIIIGSLTTASAIIIGSLFTKK